MDYEKKYKNALEWARQVMNGETGFIRKEVEQIFPELKESEDEKIRKALIKYHSFDKDGGSHALDTITPEQIVAWLEKQDNLMKALQISNSRIAELVEEKYNLEEKLKKQGEQKPTIEMITPEESLGIDSETYNKIVDECIYGEQKPINNQFTPEQANILDKHIDKFLEQKSAWSEEDEYTLGETIQHLEELIRIDKTKHCGVDVQYYQRDIDWLKSLKDRIQLQPKWSEEDEKKRKLLISILEVNHPNGHFKVNPINTLNMEAMSTKEIVTWLKSLRPQLHWKPSDEQMNALREAILEMGKSVSPCSIEEFHGIESLYNDLKKLMEE